VCRSLPIHKCYISNTAGFQTSSKHVGSNGRVQRLGFYPIFFYPWGWTGTDVIITCFDCMLGSTGVTFKNACEYCKNIEKRVINF
jgi:hypothetical protein